MNGTLLLVVANAVLAGILGLWWSSVPLQWSPPPMQPLDRASLAVPGAQPLAGDGAQFAETLQRPLFAESRRPAPAEPETTDSIEGLVLTGLYGGSATGGAIFRQKESSRRVAVGAKVGRWTLAEVNATSAVFTAGDGGRRELKLRHLAAPAVPRAGEAAHTAAVEAPAPPPARPAPAARPARSAPAAAEAPVERGARTPEAMSEARAARAERAARIRAERDAARRERKAAQGAAAPGAGETE